MGRSRRIIKVSGPLFRGRLNYNTVPEPNTKVNNAAMQANYKYRALQDLHREDSYVLANGELIDRPNTRQERTNIEDDETHCVPRQAEGDFPTRGGEMGEVIG